jgi:DNA/RNA endonuclease YhcR with UshA esterase domain
MNINFDKHKQTTLLILILAIIGLAGIYFAVIGIEPVEVSIEQIENSMTGRLVKISGAISNIRKSKTGNLYWSVDDGSSGNITVPLLDNKFKKLTARSGDAVEIIGLVSEYKGEMEIMPKEIRMMTIGDGVAGDVADGAD